MSLLTFCLLLTHDSSLGFLCPLEFSTGFCVLLFLFTPTSQSILLQTASTILPSEWLYVRRTVLQATHLTRLRLEVLLAGFFSLVASGHFGCFFTRLSAVNLAVRVSFCSLKELLRDDCWRFERREAQ